jgi:hypothetical protein
MGKVEARLKDEGSRQSKEKGEGNTVGRKAKMED